MYAGVQVPNLSGTFKKFRSLSDPGVTAWKCSLDAPKPIRVKKQTLQDVYNKGEAAIEYAFDGGDPIDKLGPYLDRHGLTMDHVDRAYKKYEKCKGGFYAHVAELWDGTQRDRIADARSGHTDPYSDYYRIENGVIVPSQNPWA